MLDLVVMSTISELLTKTIFCTLFKINKLLEEIIKHEQSGMQNSSLFITSGSLEYSFLVNCKLNDHFTSGPGVAFRLIETWIVSTKFPVRRDTTTGLPIAVAMAVHNFNSGNVDIRLPGAYYANYRYPSRQIVHVILYPKTRPPSSPSELMGYRAPVLVAVIYQISALEGRGEPRSGALFLADTPALAHAVVF
ncbi:hypothetical protein J6590_005247 [Homalodisca vitripennis]|nr:hypothetical protein J6590_005247 [Homalodisca vitripennis]